jgi:catechol 2,3-dioxygenase-like lactoylglutathione lyase family enzyme
MAQKTRGIHHISLSCCGTGELEKVVSFYHDVLGMPVIRRWLSKGSPAVMLDTGAGLIEVFSNAETSLPQGAVRHFALDVSDTDACVAAVREAGYSVTEEPNTIVIPSEPPLKARIAFCTGPLGEQIEFFSPQD